MHHDHDTGRSTVTDALDQLAIDTIRGLSIDMVQQANSGHPGTPLGAAPVAYTLWNRVLRYDPADPLWPDRDRFVLSAGHASALLWSLLHLAEVAAVGPEAAAEPGRTRAVTLDDIRAFRQIGSRCPGHPEHGWTSGVETTTGPLGQGAANSVGMALAGRWLAARYNRPGFDLFTHDVYALAGDGCMMEGIASEAASFAGHQGLSQLCWIYDANRVTIDGHTDITFTEDVVARFEAYGWNVTTVADANDVAAIERAVHDFKAESARPTLIVLHSHIGYGSPVEDRNKAHGDPLGAAGVAATKEVLGLPADQPFWVDDRVRARFAEGIGARGAAARSAWTDLVASYRAAYPAEAAELDRIWAQELPDGWDADLPVFAPDTGGLATRVSSATVLNSVGASVPWLVGGSADLASSTKTTLVAEGAGDMDAKDPGGRNLHFGIREHASAAICSGLALSGLQAYWSGFLIFSDYARGAMRLSALMELPVTHIFTHDSIAVGEDGPTHQPVEQLASLRATPGLLVFRPADANEVTEAWRTLLARRHEPSVLALSRQNVPTLDRTGLGAASGVARGGYVLAEAAGGTPAVILVATGAEVHLALAARDELEAADVPTRVVSLPCWELFERESQAYRDEVLPPEVRARVGIEAAAPLGWSRWVGDAGEVVAMDSFGASAPVADLYPHFGFTTAAVVEAAYRSVDRAAG